MRLDVAYIGTTIGTHEEARAKTDGAYWAQIEAIFALFRAAGIPTNVFYQAAAQVMWETGDLTSDLAYEFNNLSGIRPSQKKQYQAGVHNGFATYSSQAQWAQDYKRVLSLDFGKGKPIDAKNLQEFYDRLKANSYFTAAESSQYLSGITAKYNKIVGLYNAQQKAGQLFSSGKVDTYTTSSDQHDIPTSSTQVQADNAKFDAGEKLNVLTHWAEANPAVAIGAGLGVFLLLFTALKS